MSHLLISPRKNKKINNYTINIGIKITKLAVIDPNRYENGSIACKLVYRSVLSPFRLLVITREAVLFACFPLLFTSDSFCISQL